MSWLLLFPCDSVGYRPNMQYKSGGGISGWTNNDIGRHLGLSSGPNQLKEAKQYDLFGTYQGGTLYFYDADGAQTTRMQLDASQVPHLYEDFTYSSWRGLPWTYTRTDPNMPPGMENEWSWEYRYNAMGEREQKKQTLAPGRDSIAGNGYEWTYDLLGGSKEQLSVWKGLQTSNSTSCSLLQNK